MLAEDRRVVTAIEAGDPTEAERAMRAHVTAGREELRRALATRPTPVDSRRPT
jgi:DNA-binding FadR family transcriptional regulator